MKYIAEQFELFDWNNKPKYSSYFDEELALAELLKEGVVFCNSMDYMYDNKKAGHTIVLFVNCNDIFAWALADGEDLPLEELKNLYSMWKEDNRWGPAKWCCKRRNERPQGPVARDMVLSGSWEDWMYDLKENGYDKIMKERVLKGNKTNE